MSKTQCCPVRAIIPSGDSKLAGFDVLFERDNGKAGAFRVSYGNNINKIKFVDEPSEIVIEEDGDNVVVHELRLERKLSQAGLLP